ncbi:substrate-binding domain-containing protein [Clostridium sp. MCC353]|uniref:galactose ABC transporter substrate-binding protein n=1 Tax=Clostridium sp. MCC353 TaxID=2592646 RepID=UPI001C02D73C|nr:galactose ABC transporter substrate-binding protein [Clostridium sp. MCC353]MBT9779270.1 substrate-binding domain-containing protein [Clostridium sp. MCC353]
MKKRQVLIAALAVIFILGAGCIYIQSRSHVEKEEKKTLRIGVALYRGDDPFINHICGKIVETAKSYEKETGIKVILDEVDGKGDQNLQNSQVDRFISLGVDALCVNLVDRSVASYIISKAMDADIPVVFFNREPVEEDMRRWEKLYYVGEDAREAAVLQGGILVDAYKKDPSSLDLNGDGKVGYVLLEGETGHQDSLIRTEWSVRTVRDGGVPLEKITGGIGNWERSQGSAWMEQWLDEFPDEIELVISNNDEMALGAAEALMRKEITKPVKIVGIDGTPQGMEGLRTGKLFGTVQSDSEEYAQVVFRIAAAAGLGQNVQDTVELKDGKYYNCSQAARTVDDEKE